MTKTTSANKPTPPQEKKPRKILTLDDLLTDFPEVFTKKNRLAIGIDAQIKAHYQKTQGVKVKWFEMKEVLTTYVNQDWYKELHTSQAPRLNLDGTVSNKTHRPTHTGEYKPANRSVED